MAVCCGLNNAVHFKQQLNVSNVIMKIMISEHDHELYYSQSCRVFSISIIMDHLGAIQSLNCPESGFNFNEQKNHFQDQYWCHIDHLRSSLINKDAGLWAINWRHEIVWWQGKKSKTAPAGTLEPSLLWV